MKRLTGQAARGLWTLLHGTLAVVLTAVLVAGIGLGVLAWRLAQGPIALPWLTAQIEAAASASLAPDRLTIGQAALAWEGFHAGLGAPFDVRLTNIAVLDRGGTERMAVPQAAATLSLPALLRLRLVPRTVMIDRPDILLHRAADGTIGIDLAAPGPELPAPPAGGGGGAGNAGAPPPTSPPPSGAPGSAAEEGLTVAGVLTELARPPATEASPWRVGWLSQLHRLRVRAARLTVIDQPLKAVWRAPRADIDLVRAVGGGVQGSAELTLALGTEQPRLNVTVRLPRDGGPIALTAQLSPVKPAALAASAPGLAPLDVLDAPLGGTAALALGPDLEPRHLTVHLMAGAGTARIAAGTVPILGAMLEASGTPERMDIEELRVLLPGSGAAPPPVLTLNGIVTRAPGAPDAGAAGGTMPPGRIAASFRFAFDRLGFAELPRIWPEGVADGARSWILDNIPAGEARDGRFTVGLEARADGSELRVTEAAGTLEGTGLEVHWLRPVPPLRDGKAELRLLDPDRLEIDVRAARQAPEPPGRVEGPSPGGVVVRGGRMTITGLTHHDQDARIEAEVTGPIPAAIALLRDPRLGLLARHKLKLRDPAGEVDARLRVALPLLAHLTMEQVAIGVTAHLSEVHLGAVVAGRDLDDGAFDLKADTDGLTLNGTGRVAGIGLKLDGRMDFRSGPVGQVQQRVTASGQADAAALAKAGLPTLGVVTGPVGLQAVATERRGGAGEVAVRADLTAARLAVESLGWAKPEGRAAMLTADLRLDHDRLTGIDAIRLSGDPGSDGGTGAALNGVARASFIDGELASVTLDRLVLGRTELHGAVQVPPGGGPMAVRVAGMELDLASRFAPRPPGAAHTAPAKPAASSPPGPPFMLDARFATVRLAGGQTLTGLTVTGANDGSVWRRLTLRARIGATGTLAAEIGPPSDKSAAALGDAPGGAPAGAARGASAGAPVSAAAAGRALSVRASDAGALARGLGLPFGLTGGRFTLTGRYGPGPDAPLRGTAEVEEFRLRDAPVLAKLLQAVTLYGLVEVMRGPGLGISRLVAPFQLGGGVLELNNARAFSPSLGVTAAGRIDLDRDRIDMHGTIVPAYFFNALLGHLPLVGRLFSPERGGGVFAASYALSGDLNRPGIAVNPLTALTPGFLRDLFGLF